MKLHIYVMKKYKCPRKFQFPTFVVAIPIPIFRSPVLLILSNFTRTYSRTVFSISTRTRSVPVLQFSKFSVAVPYTVPIFKIFSVPRTYTFRIMGTETVRSTET